MEGRVSNEIWNQALETAANLVDPVDAPEEQEREASEVAKQIRELKVFSPSQSDQAIAVPVDIWYSIESDGCGAAGISFFLTEERADQSQERNSETDHSWGEPCTGRLETYVGSNAYAQAVRNENASAINVESW